jgi:hypothetical protein
MTTPNKAIKPIKITLIVRHGISREAAILTIEGTLSYNSEQISEHDVAGALFSSEFRINTEFPRPTGMPSIRAHFEVPTL